MKFLAGSNLTNEMQRIASGNSDTKVAIAYWGAHALKLLKINPKRENLQILCCLKGGKSAPEVIEQFGEQARQHNKLHAKVIWTKTEAIVGSANASSNGLPEEEKMIQGLIEAGVYINSPEELLKIETWFDDLFRDSMPVTDVDLKAAEEARKKRPWSREPKPELVNMPAEQLKKMKLAVLVWAVHTTTKEDKEIEKLLPQSYPESLTWWLDIRKHVVKYPWGYEALRFRVSRDRKRLLGYDGMETFPADPAWKSISNRFPLNHVIFSTYVEKSDLARRGFKVGRVSRARIGALLTRRGFRLKVYLDSGPHGLVSWEPLDELLA